MATWTDGVRAIRDGEPVNAAVANRPLEDLRGRDDYLKALIDALHLGEALRLRERSVSEDCADGMAVYYDAGRRLFAPALAEESGGQVSPRAHVVGVVEKKHSATVA